MYCTIAMALNFPNRPPDAKAQYKTMNKKQLLEFKAEVEMVLDQRKALGEFDANSKHMIFLLGNMRALIDHAISQYPKPEKKNVHHS